MTPKDKIEGLRLSEVQQLHPHSPKFIYCVVHCDSSPKTKVSPEGRPQRYLLTPTQALILSKLQGSFGSFKLSPIEHTIMSDCPEELFTINNHEAGITGYAQRARYDLIRGEGIDLEEYPS